MSSSTCAALPSATVSLSGPSSFSIDSASTSAFVIRNGSRLQLNGQPFYAAGSNIYWLGLDENVDPNPSYPSQSRVLEIMATAAAMGATAVRSTTLGVSVGCSLCLQPSLGQINQDALAAIDFAVYAAQTYGLKLIIPLVDEYDYYHGGIASFLRFRNLSDSDHSPFYDLSSPVYTDFTFYFESLLNHTSTITNVALRDDPTIAAWETGNELKNPPLTWTTSVSTRLKQLAPNHLVVDGQYGVNNQALSLNTVDIYSNHFYPLRSKVRSDAETVSNAGKVYIVGEYDWTDKYTRLPLLAGLIPVPLALLCLCLPKRWFGQRIRNPCRRRRPKRTKKPAVDAPQELSTINIPSPRQSYEELKRTPSEERTLELISEPKARIWTFKRWHLALLFLLLIPIIEGIALSVSPLSLASFLGAVSAPTVSGALFWSLFGRDNNCCAWVPHHDGFTLYFGSDNGKMNDRILRIVNQAYRATRRKPPFNNGNFLDSTRQLPAIACPQPALTIPVVSTTSATSATTSTSATASR